MRGGPVGQFKAGFPAPGRLLSLYNYISSIAVSARTLAYHLGATPSQPGPAKDNHEIAVP